MEFQKACCGSERTQRECEYILDVLYVYDKIFNFQVKFRSSLQSLTLYNNHSSPSGSYVQISHDSETPAQVTQESLTQIFNIIHKRKLM